ncbi:MAG: ACP S-malonyltransferase, partial [Planctomycetaceae bacterium]|nr:ACP S-malonyltransferase [Planctomycetaceae bacterium]
SLATAGFAFRGFDQTNLGKTPELLFHQIYGPTVEKHLLGASAIASDVLGREVDLVTRVREQRPETLAEYGEAIALIVAVEMAQLELLHEFFGIEYRAAPLALGYSLGEVSALVASGVYSIESLLTPLLALSDDLVAQADNVRMGIVFSRGPVMEFSAVERLCLEITNNGHGTIAISSYLSPNTVLVLGQRGTLDELKAAVKGRFPKGTNVKENPHRWPPIHTHITRQKHIPDRAAVMMERMPGGFIAPRPNILSCVTGSMSYTDINSRDILNRWVDEPQRLWDVVDRTISSGIELLIHVGPHPNIIPATMQRISQNVQQQLGAKTWGGLGLRAVSRIVRGNRPWLTKLISSETNLLRAPFIQEVILEDWLLAQMP